METHQRYSERADELPHAMLKYLVLAPGHTLLDVGCGPGAFHRFTLDDLPLVRAVLPTAAVHAIQNAFVVMDAEPVLRYSASGQVDDIRERPADASHRPALLASVAAQVRAILARDGVFRVPKNAAGAQRAAATPPPPRRRRLGSVPAAGAARRPHPARRTGTHAPSHILEE